MSSEKVVVGMSGGVDSSVAALRLLEDGHAVQGLFMKNWEEDDQPGYCAAAEDLADAQAVCEQLGIELRTVNFASEYWDRVFSYFLDEYRRGRTPNPDVACNSEIKFRAFLDFALGLGADSIATGHYARLDRSGGKPKLLRGVDSNKDQSYFLHALSEQQLQRVRFPLGELHKHEVRELARAAGLPTSEKKDSTGICFIGERRFSDFLKQYLPARSGDIVTLAGEVVGRHEGLMLYTIGQRKGLAIGGLRDHGSEPWYVVRKDLEHNRLVVAQGHDHPQLQCRTLSADQPRWIAGHSPALPLRCTAKIRYRQSDTRCTVAAHSDDELSATFDEPVWAAAAGQSIVFYQDQQCLGGALIN